MDNLLNSVVMIVGFIPETERKSLKNIWLGQTLDLRAQRHKLLAQPLIPPFDLVDILDRRGSFRAERCDDQGYARPYFGT